VNKKLLIIEDDPGLQSQMRWCFDDIDVFVADDSESALTCLRRHEPQVITLDLGLPPDSGGASVGFALLEEILSLAPSTKIIIVTGREDKENAVKAVGAGASDFYQKPLDADILNFVVSRAFRLYELEQENIELNQSQQPARLQGIIANSPQMLSVCRLIEKIAPADVTTLITGETGTGKEEVAKALHALSPYKDNAFAAINCGAIPENLLESELFGHEKGSFTGATQTKKGKIELADGGTLFLDEIGDMPLPLQVKLLRFLQERVIERVGGVKPIPVNVRVVCATHRNLEELILRGEFREDLFYRLSEITLPLPPLREREGDAILIARSLLNIYSKQLGRPNLTFSADAIEAIRTYSWPGNIRQLMNKVRSSIIMCDSKKITAKDLKITDADEVDESVLNLRQVREDAERKTIQRALKTTDNNIAHTSRLLGVARPTLYTLLEKYKIQTNENNQ
jgi:two-component system NtrC family response regulator